MSKYLRVRKKWFIDDEVKRKNEETGKEGHSLDVRGVGELKQLANNFLKINLAIDTNVKKVTELAEQVFRIVNKEEIMQNKEKLKHLKGMTIYFNED